MGEGFQRTYAATLGADFSVRHIQDMVVSIYDLAGDQASKILRMPYYMGSQGVIMVFDISNRDSFENLPAWFDEIRANLHSKLRVFVLGNKNDLRYIADDPVSEVEAFGYINELQKELESSISYLSTSAMTGYNVEVAFSKLLAEIDFDLEIIKND
jgi:GTPase SAR1 family protein